MLDETLDLFLGSRCVGCEIPGRMLCDPCRAALPQVAHVAWPSPTPAGLVPPWVTTSYAGAVRELVVGHKDRGQWGHRRVLGALLAIAVSASAEDLDPSIPLLLVPVPSRRGSGRRRGYEPTAAMVATAAALVSATRKVAVADVLVSRGAVADQAGLGAAARSENVSHSMQCRAGALSRLSRRWALAHVLVCDDVVTTGSTAREAQRALEAVGLRPCAVAAVAATRRRERPGDGRLLGLGPRSG